MCDCLIFFLNDTATPEIYPLPLHDALPIYINAAGVSIVMVEQNARRCLQICHRGYVLDQGANAYTGSGDDLLEDPKVVELYLDRKSTRLNSSHANISYAVFCLKKKKRNTDF